jgi:2,3-bisphosphoglycerate-independent phosphoglycerate mutase
MAGVDAIPWIRELAQVTASKIMLVVLDGVGGLPQTPGGPTELAAARTPNLDALARISALGLHDPVYPGLASGSGPGHLSLFGYDPFTYQVGRGVLSALGIGVELGPGDVAVRGNFATLNSAGQVSDRRAGRPPTSENQRVVAKLRQTIQEVLDVPVEIYSESEHRFVLILRGELWGEVSDTDSQKTGVPPLLAEPLDERSAKTAQVLNAFSQAAQAVLADEPKINGVLLRGAANQPKLPSLQENYLISPACVASYPMYKGVSRLVGMEVLPVEGEGDAIAGKLATLRNNWERFDFFFLHIKKTDSTAEDGNFDAKVAKIEEFDAMLPELLNLGPEVMLITGDHSTPSILKAHSWHPVPVLLHGPWLRNDRATRFTEDEALLGSLGRLHGPELMPLMLAHAGKLIKFGA